MAKGKKPTAGPATAGSGAPVAAAAPGKLALFPVKPPRDPRQAPPGRPVDLITNLFMMSIKQNKPIYRYGVGIEIEEINRENKDGGESSAKDGSGKAKRAIKSQELRRQALDGAMRSWITNNKPSEYNPKLNFNYLFDANGSTLYSLFNMFPKDKEMQEFRINLKLDAIIDNKLGKESRYFRVCIHPGEKMNIQALFDYCRSRTPSDMSAIQEHIRAVNVILRGKLSTIPSMVLTPLNVFPFTRESQVKIGPGVIAAKGFSISARPAECGLVLNVANSFGAFHEEIDLVDLLRTKFRVQDPHTPLRQDIIDELKREILNKQVEATHINYGTRDKPHYRKYRVGDIQGNSLEKFTLVDKVTKETSQISIKDYFKKEYNREIKFPKLPCIVDRGRKLPIEVCHLIDKQRVLRKMSPEETAEIIKHAAVRPEVHFNQIKSHVDTIKANSQSLNEFGLEFEPRPIEVTGRELDPIKLVDGSNREIRPNDGQYMGNRFFKPAVVKKWVLTFLVDRFVDMDLKKNGANRLFEKKFSQLYQDGGRFKGVNVGPMHEMNPIYLNQPDAQIKKTLKDYFKYLNKNKVDHTIIVLPKQCPDWMYRYLQYLEASCQEGRGPNESWTRCSCLKYENYMRKIIDGRDGGKMFISNLWLKYNTKFGGINYVLKKENHHTFLNDGYIFISIDVCHPAPGDKLIQSVAAVVGMWDLTSANMSYCTQLRVQKKQRENHSTIEEVGEIGNMIEEVLEGYRLKKNKLPTHIVIIRDGVSEGQFRIVLEGELKKVFVALHRKYTTIKAPRPQLSCMVVQKRHKVRFMRKVAAQSRKGPDFNIQPGTVVDSKITHPTDFSFYLAPHKAIQGTSKAAHIYMICDEIKFSQDQAQAMVHALSYLSPRCTKSTSIPTPVNLADLAAEQGKNLVICWVDENGAPGKGQKVDEEARLKQLNLFLSRLADSNYKNTLYYV